MMMLVKSGGPAAFPEWQTLFAEYAPHLDVRWWDDPSVRPEDVHYVLCWEPEHGRLAAMPNLQLICSSAAGVDHITADPNAPLHLPLVRMGSDETAQRMGEFVALGVLSLLRDMKRIVDAQARRQWDNFDVPRCATQTRAGMMGLGNLGSRSAEMLRDLGFITAGWSLTRKSIAGVESFAGADEMEAFLARTDILVCLLPDTPATRGILNARTLGLLPKRAGLVNVARGTHVVTHDLLAALDTGQLSGAILDVFDREPLPAESSLWTHPKIIIASHVASNASKRARVQYVAKVLAAFERGEKLPNLYSPERGY
jgi:glyoxylate/hydroxypyruvate reductase A